MLLEILHSSVILKDLETHIGLEDGITFPKVLLAQDITCRLNSLHL